ncbi:hypothetical protein QF001_002767 [Paraburkholderia youngii]
MVSSERVIQTWSHSSPFELCIVVSMSTAGAGPAPLLEWSGHSTCILGQEVPRFVSHLMTCSVEALRTI